MTPVAAVLASAGWTLFSGVFSTFFPLIVLLAVLTWYWLVGRRYP